MSHLSRLCRPLLLLAGGLLLAVLAAGPARAAEAPPAPAAEEPPSAEAAPAPTLSERQLCHPARRDADEKAGVACPTPAMFWSATALGGLTAVAAWVPTLVAAPFLAVSAGPASGVHPLLVGIGVLSATAAPLGMIATSSWVYSSSGGDPTAILGGAALGYGAVALLGATGGVTVLWSETADVPDGLWGAGLIATYSALLLSPLFVAAGARAGAMRSMRRAAAPQVSLAPMIGRRARGLALTGRF